MTNAIITPLVPLRKSNNSMLAAHEDIVTGLGFELVFVDSQGVAENKILRRYWQNADGDLYVFEVKGKSTFAGTLQLPADSLGSIKRWLES